jgi:hypothetical protein
MDNALRVCLSNLGSGAKIGCFLEKTTLRGLGVPPLAEKFGSPSWRVGHPHTRIVALKMLSSIAFDLIS